MNKNLIDSDEYVLSAYVNANCRYPMLTTIHQRCVSMLADIWHAPSAKQAMGTATTGSSEAIQMAGLAMKRIWQGEHFGVIC